MKMKVRITSPQRGLSRLNKRIKNFGPMSFLGQTTCCLCPGSCCCTCGQRMTYCDPPIPVQDFVLARIYLTDLDMYSDWYYFDYDSGLSTFNASAIYVLRSSYTSTIFDLNSGDLEGQIFWDHGTYPNPYNYVGSDCIDGTGLIWQFSRGDAIGLGGSSPVEPTMLVGRDPAPSYSAAFAQYVMVSGSPVFPLYYEMQFSWTVF